MTKFLISHDSGNTVNGLKVGRVYVRRLADSIPGYPENVFSYTKDPALATTWPTQADAEAECSIRHWRNTRIISQIDAQPLT